MSIELRAASRLLGSFNDAQRQMARQHLIPQLEALIPEYFSNATTWLPSYMEGAFKTKERFSAETPTGVAMHQTLLYLKAIKSVLEAVDGRGSDAARAAGLKKAVTYTQKQFSWNRGAGNQPPEKYPAMVMRLIRKVPSSLLTDKGQQVVQFVNSQYFKLLAKSWKWILQECENEFHEIVDRSKLHMVGDHPDERVIFEAMKQVLPNWKFSEAPDKYAFNNKKPVLKAESPDGLTEFEICSAAKVFNGEDEYSIIPRFRTKPEGGWFSWERVGVDFGDTSFAADTHSIEHAVEVLLKKVNDARAKHLEREQGGKTYDFGPVQKLMMPDEFQKAVDRLKAGRMFSIEPSGFGIAYVFTTKDSRWFKPASKAISDAVGRPVFYHEEDRD